MADEDRLRYNSMQQAAGIVPSFAAPYAPTSAQVSSQVAAMGAMQLQSMMAVTQIGQQPMGPFGSPSFPQLQTPFIGSPGVMPGPGGALYAMTPAGAASPYGGYGGYGAPMGMAGQSAPPGNVYSAMPGMPPPAYRGAMGMPGLMPFSPPPPLSQFDTPYQAAITQSMATGDRAFGGMMTTGGIGARLGMDTGMGMLGARVGRRYGGGVGALLGGVAGFLGAEVSGMGGFAQNTFMENAALPAMNTRAYGASLEQASRSFISGGSELGPTGAGWSPHGATRAAAGLESLAGSAGFQRETFGRFNTADVMRITQASGREGLLSGVETGGDLKGRVRDIAKSLTSFMELANEPDVLRAIQVMGQMRTSGLNLSETQQAVQHGRMFARTAGTSFEGLANTGGAMGSSAYQSLGLTQGLGMVSGMANTGLAAAANNSGMLSPQVMNMLGGTHGLAGLNTMFSAGMLQMPMMAPGMMNAQGGLDQNALRALLSGQISPTGMTARGSNTMSQMGQTMGAGGLGMALGLQPLLQDTIGRVVQSQGPFAQRHMEDRQVMALMRNMNLSGSEGFMTAAQMMGMSGPQAMARAREMGDPRTFTRERQQIEVNRRDRRAEELRSREASQPGVWDELESSSSVFAAVGGFGRSITRGVSDRYLGLAGGGAGNLFAPDAASERRIRQLARSSDIWSGGVTREESGLSRLGRYHDLAENQGGAGLGALLGAGVFGLTGGRTINLRNTFNPNASILESAGIDAHTRDAARTGAALSTIANTSHGEHAAAMRGLRSTFGSEANLDRFNSSAARLFGDSSLLSRGGANLLFRGGAAALTRGLVDPGNVSGAPSVMMGQLRSAYVTANRGDGRDPTRLGQEFDQNSGLILAQAAPGMRVSMTRAEEAQFNRVLSRLPGQAGGGRALDPEAGERAAYEPLMGGAASNREARSRVNRFFGFQGFGSTDAARSRSANYMSTRSILQLRLEGASGEEQTRLSRQIQDLNATARRQGVDVSRAEEQMSAQHLALRNDNSAVDAAKSLNLGTSGASALQAVTDVARNREINLARTRVSDGFTLLSRQGGAVGDLFRGAMNNGTVDEAKLKGQLTSIAGNEDQLRALQATNPELARIARQYATGSRRDQAQAWGALQVLGHDQGQRVEGARREYGQTTMLSRAHRAFNRGGWTSYIPVVGAYRGIRGAMQTEQDAINDATSGGTAADAEAVRQTSDSSAMQNQTGEAGIGGAADRLTQAAESLERAATAFQRGVQDQNMDSLFQGVRGP